METITKIYYKCSVCGHQYDSEQEAKSCESMPVQQDKGVKIGDKVLITSGDGRGEIATVNGIYIQDKYWGHYAWKRYWHTVAVVADIDNSWGTRLLTFDSYEPCKS